MNLFVKLAYVFFKIGLLTVGGALCAMLVAWYWRHPPFITIPKRATRRPKNTPHS